MTKYYVITLIEHFCKHCSHPIRNLSPSLLLMALHPSAVTWYAASQTITSPVTRRGKQCCPAYVCTVWPGTSPGGWAQSLCGPGCMCLSSSWDQQAAWAMLFIRMTTNENSTFCIRASQKCSTICAKVIWSTVNKNNHRYLYTQTWKWRVHLKLHIYNCKTSKSSFIQKSREWDRNPFPLSVLNGLSIAPSMK